MSNFHIARDSGDECRLEGASGWAETLPAQFDFSALLHCVVDQASDLKEI